MPAEVASRAIRAGSHLERILASGEFAVTAEVATPVSVDVSEIRRHASLYRGTVDGCNVTDGQRALVRISSMAGATIALQEGVEPIMQMVSRDRNRIGLQSDLLGAAALGIRNVLCLGRPAHRWQREGGQSGARPEHGGSDVDLPRPSRP